jgi:hypothetical protein
LYINGSDKKEVKNIIRKYFLKKLVISASQALSFKQDSPFKKTDNTRKLRMISSLLARKVPLLLIGHFFFNQDCKAHLSWSHTEVILYNASTYEISAALNRIYWSL